MAVAAALCVANPDPTTVVGAITHELGTRAPMAVAVECAGGSSITYTRAVADLGGLEGTAS